MRDLAFLLVDAGKFIAFWHADLLADALGCRSRICRVFCVAFSWRYRLISIRPDKQVSGIEDQRVRTQRRSDRVDSLFRNMQLFGKGNGDKPLTERKFHARPNRITCVQALSSGFRSGCASRCLSQTTSFSSVIGCRLVGMIGLSGERFAKQHRRL